MVLAPEMRARVFPLFVREAVENLQKIEEDLQALPQDPSPSRVGDLIRAAHTIKGGAAYVNLPSIRTLAQLLEGTFRSLQRAELVVDIELDALLSQAFTCLRLPLLDCIRTGACNATADLAQAEPVFERLKTVLGSPPEAAAELSSFAELGGICESILTVDVPQVLQELEAILSDLENSALVEELRVKAEVFAGFGELIEQPRLGAIAKVVLATLATNPEHADTVGQLALVGWRKACKEILQECTSVEKLRKKTQKKTPNTSSEIDTSIRANETSLEKRDRLDSSETMPPAEVDSLEQIFGSLTILPDSNIPTQAPSGSTGFPALPDQNNPRSNEQNTLYASNQESSAVQQPLPLPPVAGANINVPDVSSPIDSYSDRGLRLKASQHLIWIAGSVVLALRYTHIEGNVAPDSDRIVRSGRQQFLHWQDRVIPIYQLSDLLSHHSVLPDFLTNQDWSGSSLDASQSTILLVLTIGGRNVALISSVDYYFTEPELAVNPFSTAIARPDYLQGFTFRETGHLMPVINVAIAIRQMIDKDGSISKTLKNTESPSPTGVDLMTNLASHPPTILLVDDSKTVRHMLAITLQEAGFWTLQAVDGKEAIAQLRNHAEVQLVVCDLEMPNMNGLEFLTYRRQDSLLSLVPVVMLSFRDDRRYKQLAMQLGATAYFTKPYVEKEFIATLRVILHSNN